MRTLFAALAVPELAGEFRMSRDRLRGLLFAALAFSGAWGCGVAQPTNDAGGAGGTDAGTTSQSLPDGGIGARDSSVRVDLKSIPLEVSLINGRVVYDNTGSAMPSRTLLFLFDFTPAAPAGAYMLSCDSDPNWVTTATATPMRINNATSGSASTQESESCVVRANSASAPDTTLKFTVTEPGGNTLRFDLSVGLAH